MGLHQLLEDAWQKVVINCSPPRTLTHPSTSSTGGNKKVHAGSRLRKGNLLVLCKALIIWLNHHGSHHSNENTQPSTVNPKGLRIFPEYIQISGMWLKSTGIQNRTKARVSYCSSKIGGSPWKTAWIPSQEPVGETHLKECKIQHDFSMILRKLYENKAINTILNAIPFAIALDGEWQMLGH